MGAGIAQTVPVASAKPATSTSAALPQLTAAEIVEHVRGQIARYKAPRDVQFVAALPKTSTGKVQKFELREK